MRSAAALQFFRSDVKVYCGPAIHRALRCRIQDSRVGGEEAGAIYSRPKSRATRLRARLPQAVRFRGAILSARDAERCALNLPLATRSAATCIDSFVALRAVLRWYSPLRGYSLLASAAPA